MNHLAHVRLAPAEPALRVGSLLGDFARGADLSVLPPAVRAGIAHHRAVDRFTDAHPMFRRSRARIAAPRARVAPVLVDVFYDHFLAVGWAALGDGSPLPAFTEAVYDDLRAHRGLLPLRLRDALPRMIANDWLTACRELDGTAAVLQRLQARLRHPLPLSGGIDDLRADYRGFAADFAVFWPELCAYCESYNAAIGNWRGPSSSQTANGDG